MELLTASNSEYLLNGSIEMLHKQSTLWIDEVEFWRDELAFFYALIVKKTLKGFPDNIKTQVENTEKELVDLSSGDLGDLFDKIISHEVALSLLLESKYEDEQSYREKHLAIAAKVKEFELRFKALKKEVFKIVE